MPAGLRRFEASLCPSPIYGRHPEAAADAARALRERVVPTAPAKVVTPAAAQVPAAR